MEEFSSFWSSLGPLKASRLPRIAFSDSTDIRVLKAVDQLIKEKKIHPILIGVESTVNDLARASGLPNFDSIYFPTPLTEADKKRLIEVFNTRSTKSAEPLDLNDSLSLGVSLLLDGQVDGLVGGSLRPTADVVRAALKGVGPKAGVRLVAGHFWIETVDRKTSDGGPFLLADCAVMPEPSANALAAIAVEAGRAYHYFTGKTPRVAFLSFSTKGSAEHLLVDRIRQAMAAAHKLDPNLIFDGELQADAALDAGVAVIKKAGDSPVAGKANVLVFPTLESGNVGYKLIQRFSKTRIAGPLLWGLNKPMSDLSRGCTIQEVVDTAAFVAAMVHL